MYTSTLPGPKPLGQLFVEIGLMGEEPGPEFDDFNDDRSMWEMPCCGADYDCICH
jgi:hypothetical protein